MWKKILLSVVLIAAIIGGLCFLRTHFEARQTSKTPVTVVAPHSFDDLTYSYNMENLSPNCELNSEMACAVDFTIKCTINPDYQGCRQSKLPKFIFMSDEALMRPTEMSFKINKIKPIAADLIEIHTDSTCNGNWFGLCQGHVIYVLVPENESWRVKDIYAIEK